MVWTYPWPSMTSILRRFQVLGRFVGHLIRVLSSEQKKKLRETKCSLVELLEMIVLVDKAYIKSKLECT